MLSPQENLTLFGHDKEKDFFLNTFHSARFPHAWILAGPFGIGKATFAFHMARYILSGRQDKNTHFEGTEPLARRIAVQTHGDLWARGGDSEITVDTIRTLNSFLNKTSAEGGWRVLIIDGAESLNHHAANALLKRLEEPPQKTVCFLITTTPAQLLPTLRSRCQRLSLSYLDDQQVKEVFKTQGLSPPSFSSSEQGSPGHLNRLMEGNGPRIYADIQKIFNGAPSTSFIHTYEGDAAAYDVIENLLRNFLYTQLMEKMKTHANMDLFLSRYEKIDHLLTQCRFSQLDKRTTLTCVFENLTTGS